MAKDVNPGLFLRCIFIFLPYYLFFRVCQYYLIIIVYDYFLYRVMIQLNVHIDDVCKAPGSVFKVFNSQNIEMESRRDLKSY